MRPSPKVGHPEGVLALVSHSLQAGKLGKEAFGRGGQRRLIELQVEVAVRHLSVLVLHEFERRSCLDRELEAWRFHVEHLAGQTGQAW